jgi:hypothetical protein
MWPSVLGPQQCRPLTFLNARSSGLNSDWLFAEASSLREADTSKQIVETRVWAQPVKPEISL